MSEQKDRAILTEKQEYLRRCQVLSTRLEEVFTEAGLLLAFWADNNYDSELSDLDIANFRFSKEELQSYVNLLEQINSFATGGSTTSGNYRAINNRIK